MAVLPAKKASWHVYFNTHSTYLKTFKTSYRCTNNISNLANSNAAHNANDAGLMHIWHQ